MPTALYPGHVGNESAKGPWVAALPKDEPSKISLGRLVEADGGRDGAENEYYERAADPSANRIEAAQRRFRAQFRRRQRHREARARRDETQNCD